jgi:putative ABC transport system permease protein
MSLVGLSAGPAPRLALQNLLQDKLRLVLSVVGIALAVMLILFLLGLRQGVFRSTTIYLDKAPGSIAVLPAGVKSSHGHGQYLTPETIKAISATPGVARVVPVQLQLVVLELHGKKEDVQLIGYQLDLGGGPWNLAKGREPQADNEIVLDRALANRHDIGVGDSFNIKGQQLTVVGLSNETSAFTGAYAFARQSFVEKLTLSPGATYAFVTQAAGTSRSDLIAALKPLPDTNVVPKSEIMTNDRKIIAQIMDQIVYLMVAAAFIVGALVVGMVIYSATIDRRSEYGILKAIGARSGVLYRVVALQALIAASLGSLLGVGFAFAMGSLVTNLKPQFLVSIEPSAILLTLAAGFVMALAGALFPARSVTSLAPAEVFRR